jgi:hypothetical protein
MIVPCPTCGKDRDLVRDRKTSCRSCVAEARRQSLNVDNLEHRIHLNGSGIAISQYLRVCECGGKRWVGYIPETGTKCRACAARSENGIATRKKKKEVSNLVRYERVCANCGDVKILRAQLKYRKTMLCGTCSRKSKKEFVPKKVVEKKVVEKKVVKLKVKIAKKKVIKVKKRVLPKKSRTPSKQAIDRARKINEEHRIAQANVVKKDKIKESVLTDEEMIANYLKVNKVKILESVGTDDRTTLLKRNL